MKHEKMIVTDPSNNFKIIDEVEASTPEQIDAKVALARQGFTVWSKMSLQDRISALSRVHDELQRRQDDIAHAIAQETGMPITICKEVDIAIGLQYMKGYLQHGPSWLKPETVFENYKEKHQMYFEPYGVIAVSVPWNYPFTNFIWPVIQNLVAGNTIVVKHSEHSMLAAQLYEQIFKISAIPEGVCNFVYGKGFDVGNYLMNANVDKIWFTGSTQTGQTVYQIAAQKMIPVTLELGGSAPGIVFDDIDIDLIMPALYFYRFLNSGQTCDSLKRLMVQRSIFDQLITKLTAYVAQQKIGSALDVNTMVGPLVNQKQLERLELQVQDAVQKGARIVIGGKRPTGLHGAYFEPTIITGITRDMKIWKEEVFGPVIPIVSFESEDEAIALANDTIYGLGGYLFTLDSDRIARICAELKTGNISVNGSSYMLPTDSFGGYKMSGIGRIHGKLGMRNLCAIKTVAELKNTLLVKIMFVISSWLPVRLRFFWGNKIADAACATKTIH